jgi:pimeloyl-ACP methyl ester carboxylesterase
LRDVIEETDPVLPETRFAKTADGVNVAYQILGDGPVDIVFCRPVHSNLEHEWEEPVFTRIFRRLASIGRLIRFDRRGMGLSDRIRGERLPTIEERMEDMRAVLDAVNSDRALLIGLVHATPLCMVFAASHPERTIGLVTFEAWARGSFAPDYPWAMTEEELDRWVEEIHGGWGRLNTRPRRSVDSGPVVWATPATSSGWPKISDARRLPPRRPFRRGWTSRRTFETCSRRSTSRPSSYAGPTRRPRSPAPSPS